MPTAWPSRLPQPADDDLFGEPAPVRRAPITLDADTLFPED